ncbi:MAG TPA: hypothetical protein VFT70_03110 [Nocardioides sp.]|nr:hypothetical protein [Nocardioides sp.]
MTNAKDQAGTDESAGEKARRDDEAERQAIADVDQQLDEQSGRKGLAAEAGRGEEYGLAEG